MPAIGSRQREHHLAIAGDLQGPRGVAVVDERDAPHLRGIVGHDRHLGASLDAVVSTVKRHAIGREKRMVPLGRRTHGLVRRRPDLSSVDVLHIAELAGVIRGAVRAPPRDIEIAVAAVAAAGVAEHDRVRQAPEERHVGPRCIGRVDLAHDGSLERRIGKRILGARFARGMKHELPWNPLVQQQRRGAHQRVGVKPAGPDVAGERVGERDQRHPHVVRHEIAHDRVALAGVGTRVIERVVEAEVAQRALLLEGREVRERLLRRHGERERGSVGRDDQVLSDAALERELRNAKGAILIRVVPVTKVIRAFTGAPGHAVLVAVGDLPPHRAVIRLVEQRQRERVHDERRHEILEHASAP